MEESEKTKAVHCPYAASGPMCEVKEGYNFCDLCLKGLIVDNLDRIFDVLETIRI